MEVAPLIREIVVYSFCPSSTSATSPTVMSPPWRVLPMTSCRSSSMEVNFPARRTTYWFSPSLIFPVGKSRLELLIVLATWSIESPYERSFAASMLTRISRSSPPTSVIWPTPASLESLGCILSFTNWKNSRDPIVDVTPIRRTGSSSRANLVITGGLASFGSRLRTSFTFLWASCSDVLTSAVRSNSICTKETPSREELRTVEILSIPETASSTTFVTAVSTSSGEAPG